MDTKYECKEGGTIKQVLHVFSGEIMKTQQSCGPYRIDLYLPEYRLAIECDENNHDDRDPDYERKRARFIKRKLQCEIIRYNPDAEDFNILHVINQIFRYIKEYIQLEKELEE